MGGPLYLFQDGKKEKIVNGQLVKKDDKLLGETVVTHGTLYPGQIHKKPDPKTGGINYLITGGDRSQLFGLRGQMIDWLVSSCAASPKHQKALIDAFTRKYPDVKQRRGLAMHVMYRCIMESEWFMKRGMTNEVENLAKLVHAILTGSDVEWDGVWAGVNTPMIEQR